jgi:hypothetical protein
MSGADLLDLPAAFALADFLPYARETGSFLPQRRRLPVGGFAIWTVGITVHFCYHIGQLFRGRRGQSFLPVAAKLVLSGPGKKLQSALAGLYHRVQSAYTELK